MSKKDEHGISAAALGALMRGDIENALTALAPGGIEAQEARGQADFVESQTLPIDGLEWRYNRGEKYEISPKEYLERLGFVFLEQEDDLFINVRFPEGWKIEPTNHSMWSELVDDKGRNRAGIFYKAAFYDRNAHFDLDRRYSITEIYDHMDGYISNVMQYIVRDDVNGGEVLYETAMPYDEKYEGDYWKIQDEVLADAKAWLGTNYPDWESPMAYWD